MIVFKQASRLRYLVISQLEQARQDVRDSEAWVESAHFHIMQGDTLTHPEESFQRAQAVLDEAKRTLAEIEVKARALDIL